jgi:hypothetical protein
MGNKQFTTWDSLFKYLEEQVEVNIQKIGEEIKGVLRNNVRLLWYERDFTPQYYTRTYELIDSITCRKAKKTAIGTYEVEIYFDTDKINPYPSENGEWSKHESITDGSNVSQYIPQYIEEGQNSSIYSYEGVHPVRETVDWEKDDRYLKNRMKELLEDKGFICI